MDKSYVVRVVEHDRGDRMSWLATAHGCIYQTPHAHLARPFLTLEGAQRAADFHTMHTRSVEYAEVLKGTRSAYSEVTYHYDEVSA